MQMDIKLCHLTSNSSVHGYISCQFWDNAPIIGSSQLNSRLQTNSTKYLSKFSDIMTLDVGLCYGPLLTPIMRVTILPARCFGVEIAI